MVRPHTGYEASGFTLIELMVVVVLVAILSVVAMASYKKYQRNARVNDGIAYVQDIRMKQETFFSTYSRYLASTDPGASDVFDGIRQEDDFEGMYVFAPACPDADIVWCNLGFTPAGSTMGGVSNLVWFQFQTIGWAPGRDVPDFFATAPTNRWLSVRARGLYDTGRCTYVEYLSNVPDLIVRQDFCGD